MSSNRGRSFSGSRYNNAKNQRPDGKQGDDRDSTSKDRYDLRSTLKSKRDRESSFTVSVDSRSSRKKMSWAEQCEAVENGVEIPQDENSVSSPMKALKVDDNGDTDYRDISLPAKNGDVKVKESPMRRSGRKRERNLDQPTEFTPISPSLEGAKRRLGWCRSKLADDAASTTSSSMYSSDNDLDSEKSEKQYETDPAILQRRQKQIDYGKNTKGYKLYLEAVPKLERESKHIFTPKKHIKYSRRSWDSQIKIWRKRLHEWDPRSDDEGEDAEVDLSDMVGMI